MSTETLRITAEKMARALYDLSVDDVAASRNAAKAKYLADIAVTHGADVARDVEAKADKMAYGGR